MKSLNFNVFLLVLFTCLVDQIHSQGDVWKRIQPTPQEHSLYCVRQIPGTETIVAVGDGSTIMYSDDDGESWEIALNPAGLPNNTQLRSINFYDEENGYAADYTGRIIRTTNGGQSWDLIYNQTHDTLKTDRVDIYLSDAETAIIVGYNRLILKTEDGGDSWSSIVAPIGFYPNSIDFVNQDTGFIVGAADTVIILKTTNGGNNWIAHSLQVENIPIYYDIHFINETTGIISGSDNDAVYIFKTDNSGDS